MGMIYGMAIKQKFQMIFPVSLQMNSHAHSEAAYQPPSAVTQFMNLL